MQPSPPHPIAAVRSGEDLTFTNLVGCDAVPMNETGRAP